jgi:hypothetical protein
VPEHLRMRGFDRDLIRAGHYGQRPCEPHQQAEHMAAPTRPATYRKKSLPMRSRSLIADLDASSILLISHFFCSTAPQAFSRPDQERRSRRAETLSRLAALERPPLGWS